MNSNKSYVICQLCKKKFRQINNAHLRFKHGITSDEYKKNFGLDKVSCQEFRDAISKSKVGNKYWVGKKHKKLTIKKILKNRHYRHSIESKGKISKAMKGNQHAKGMHHNKKFKRYISNYNKKWWMENRDLFLSRKG